MLTLKGDVSRPVLGIELLVCFGSLVFAGIQYGRVVFGAPSLLAKMDPGLMIWAGIIGGAAGVLALLAGWRQLNGGKVISVGTASALIAGFGFLALALLRGAGEEAIGRELVLLCVLPIVGTLHLRYLGSTRRAELIH